MAQIFPRWTNEAPRLLTLGGLAGLGAIVFAFYWWASPLHTDVGYAPKQPVPYSHALHVSQLKLDCRYCHSSVEMGPMAGVPSTQTCMNCHAQVRKDSPKLKLVRASFAEGKGDKSIEWVRVHKLPDYAYFDHSAHVGLGVGENRAAIGCETCHGRIDTMDVVRQVQPLSMSWCVDCHSNPGPNLRPVEALTAMGWTADLAWAERQKQIAPTLNPPGSLSQAQRFVDGHYKTYATVGCSGCHR